MAEEDILASLSSGLAQNMCRVVTLNWRGELQGTLSSEYIIMYVYIAARVFLAAIFFIFLKNIVSKSVTLHKIANKRFL